MRVAANILHVLADISRVVADKAVEEAKSCWPMNFFSIFGDFFKKCSKNGLVSEKNYFIFFHFLWGGQTQKWKFSLYFFIFF